MKRFRTVPVAVALALVVSALAVSSVLAWSPLQLTVDCGSNGQLTWIAKANGPEFDLNVDFADNSGFIGATTQTLDSTTLSTQFTTSTATTQGWVRWSSDHTVVTGPVNAPTGCQHDVIAPAGSIGGPCYDASYYGVFDNSATTSQSIKFRFRWETTTGWHTKSRLVPAGAKFMTWDHWAKPGTTVWLGYKDPNTGTWINLAHLTAAHGSFPPCDYTPGWTHP